MSRSFRCAEVMLGILVCSSAGLASDVAFATGSPDILLSEVQTLRPSGGRNPTVAVDQQSQVVYVTWAQEVPRTKVKRHRSDPRLEVLLTRTDDGGLHFLAPQLVSMPKDQVTSAAVSPARVQVGSKGEVYVAYPHLDLKYTLLGERFRDLLRLVRSEDGGRTFTSSAEIGSEAIEGAITSLGMTNLFAAPDGVLYASWLDTRETFAYAKAHTKWPALRNYSSQLRVSRSLDGGRSFQRSALVAKPVCVCCSTKVAQGISGPLYASTRGLDWSEAKGSTGSIRDIVVASSADQGTTWSSSVKVHDDHFKVDTCPDVTGGLAVDTHERLVAAWYTGSERRQGVFYAISADHGMTFSEPLALLTDASVPYADVKLALDAGDNAWVAFEDKRDGNALIRLIRVGADGTVAAAEAWPGTSPDLAALGDGIVVTWQSFSPEGEEAGGSILARRARAGPSP